MNKEWVRCSVYGAWWYSTDVLSGFCNVMTQRATLLILSRASLCCLTHFLSYPNPVSIDFTSSVVNLSESCPVHLCQCLCLWYKQSIWLSQTVWNLAFSATSRHGRSIVCVLYSIAKKRLTPQNGHMKGKMDPLLGQEMCKWGLILTMGNSLTTVIHIFMLWLPCVPWATL